jgi:predicted branched-subunit amino acid permease
MQPIFSPSFRAGAREGFQAFLPLSVGLIPWALVTGMSMVSVGFTPLQAMGMNIIVFAVGAPVWLIVATALALNLRFVIFSAAIAQGFRGMGSGARWLCGHLLTDGVFATCVAKMMETEDRQWRLGYYLAPSVWTWLLWQCFALTGVLAAGSIPKNWSLEFMATIALMVLLLPMAKMRPMLVAALAGGMAAVVLHDLPLKLGLFAAIFIGIGAGLAADHWQEKREAA